jgi:hypothetical protein
MATDQRYVAFLRCGAALTRHRSPADPDVAAARREVREAQLEADLRRVARKYAAAAERDALLASSQDGAR